MRKTVTEITDGAAHCVYLLPKIRVLGRRRSCHDVDLRERGILAVLDRGDACDAVVDLHPGVRYGRAVR